MSEIRPALTAEEWVTRLTGDFGEHKGSDWLDGFVAIEPSQGPGEPALMIVSYDCGYPQRIPPEERHAAAALALHGQSFGFAREDVRMLRMYSAMFDGARNGTLASIADRIEALLPHKDIV